MPLRILGEELMSNEPFRQRSNSCLEKCTSSDLEQGEPRLLVGVCECSLGILYSAEVVPCYNHPLR